MATYAERKAREENKKYLRDKFSNLLKEYVKAEDTFFYRVIAAGNDTKTITVLRAYVTDGKPCVRDVTKQVACACDFYLIDEPNAHYLRMRGSQYNPGDYLKDSLIKLFGFNVSVEEY